MVNHLITETPFAYRFICWFCGEPTNKTFSFPQHSNYIPDCVHPPMSIYTCAECLRWANAAHEDNIWQVRFVVKKALINHYKKHLAIGINWTKKSLEESGFEQGNFASFQKSAWMMYEIARDRVNFSGWPIEINGNTLDSSSAFITQPFCFDGVEYPSIEQAINQYAENFSLNKHYLKQVLSVVGKDNFALAIRFCRVQVGATPQERASALRMLSVDYTN
ncbi:hypothetical protein Q4489_09690 [Thalassotalea sp. 1_MG-2023]|uniref:hypothetical protein n=1 Tax=Thalassotalea sp. 1_MG-2023 TaxID=3062680 RepID=UPI0026E19D93|nr:hypothetical protein [Thalassotalea sp. 1_MG-2023]MDO6427285.1 hypothetical protein [Thalassotalea sp. 1_MG-2023]